MPPTLAVLQTWMQAVIQHPAGVAAGLESPMAQACIPVGIETLNQILPATSKQSSQERLQIYAQAYFARLLEVLQAEYPTLRHYMGDELFTSFASSYLQQRPSRSYTLSQLGQQFPQYLKETRPPAMSDRPDWADFLINCARLERVYAEVFDGPGPEFLGSESAEISPNGVSPEEFLTRTICVTPWVELLELQFPVHLCTSSVRQGQPIDLPEARPTWLLVTRREFIVRRSEISRGEFVLLSAMKSGLTVEQALGRLIEVTGPTKDLASQVRQWFRQWTAARYITRE
ncbi:hypothetical protein GC163_24090 [bacterium]|nr:hypothetical protein [bacterium]